MLYRQCVGHTAILFFYDFNRFFFGLNNCVHPKLKLMMNISFTTIQFLDFTIYNGPKFDQTGQLSYFTSIFFKQTNTFLYLRGSSYTCTCVSKRVHNEIVVGKIVQTLHNTFSKGYFNIVK